MANECIPFFDEGDQITGTATAAVTGKRFVAISGNRQADGTISIAPPAAGGRVFGVAEQDAAVGRRVGIIRERGSIVPVTAPGAAIVAFGEVEVDVTGGVIPHAAGVAVGYVVDACPGGGADAMVSLY